jgi:hypothetical protein
MLFTVQCDLYSEDTIEPRNLVYPPGTTSFPLEKDEKVIDIDTTKSVRNLVGSVVSNAYELKNLADEVGTFFIFNDLSVRTEGVFTLRFLFSDLGSGYTFLYIYKIKTIQHHLLLIITLC